MIARYQAILFGLLLAASIVMGVVLWHLRERAHQRLLMGEDSAPTQAPQVAPAEQATLLVANDMDNSLLTQEQTLPLPADPGARARLVLGKLLDLYAAPDATHPVPGGASSIAQVFLLPAPSLTANAGPQQPDDSKPEESKTNESRMNESRMNGSRMNESRTRVVVPDSLSAQAKALQSGGPELAVVNLTGSFVASHPSGLEAETLTILSICGTLHANLPRVTQVRFLVDGQTHATLAGHADLTRTYLATDAVPTEGVHP